MNKRRKQERTAFDTVCFKSIGIQYAVYHDPEMPAKSVPGSGGCGAGCGANCGWFTRGAFIESWTVTVSNVLT